MCKNTYNVRVYAGCDIEQIGVYFAEKAKPFLDTNSDRMKSVLTNIAAEHDLVVFGFIEMN